MMNQIELSIKDVFWSTRGKSWDYLYLVTPDIEMSWYKFIKTARQHNENKYVIGEVICANNEKIAFVFFEIEDPEFKDEVHRKILHTFVILLDYEKLLLLPSDLDVQVYESVKHIYENIYALSDLDRSAEKRLQEIVKNSNYKSLLKLSAYKININKNDLMLFETNATKPIRFSKVAKNNTSKEKDIINKELKIPMLFIAILGLIFSAYFIFYSPIIKDNTKSSSSTAKVIIIKKPLKNVNPGKVKPKSTTLIEGQQEHKCDTVKLPLTLDDAMTTLHLEAADWISCFSK